MTKIIKIDLPSVQLDELTTKWFLNYRNHLCLLTSDSHSLLNTFNVTKSEFETTNHLQEVLPVQIEKIEYYTAKRNSNEDQSN